MPLDLKNTTKNLQNALVYPSQTTIPLTFYSKCFRCWRPIDLSVFQAHSVSCTGTQSIPEKPDEPDKTIDQIDLLMEEELVRLHLYLANFVYVFSVGTCAIAETSVLPLLLDAISTVKSAQLNGILRMLSNYRSSITERMEDQQRRNKGAADTRQRVDQSFLVLLDSLVALAGYKASLIAELPENIQLLLCSLRQIDSETNWKMEQLKMWRSKSTGLKENSVSPSTVAPNAPVQAAVINR